MRSMTFISMAFLLFFVIDPIGNVPIFLNALRKVPVERHRTVILREIAVAYTILLLFGFVGRHFLQLLHLSQTSLGIAGGIILFLIAIKMIFPTSQHMFGTVEDAEPFIFPLAIPIIAGPSALATVLLLVSSNPGRLWVCIGSLTLAMGVASLILVSSGKIALLVGTRAMNAVERLMGLILTAIAVQMLLEGIRTFVKTL